MPDSCHAHDSQDATALGVVQPETASVAATEPSADAASQVSDLLFREDKVPVVREVVARKSVRFGQAFQATYSIGESSTELGYEQEVPVIDGKTTVRKRKQESRGRTPRSYSLRFH